MMDLQTQERFIELRAQGWSYDKIAKELKVSKKTLISLGRRLKEEIASRKTLELDRLRDEYFLTSKAKIELFGERVIAIKQELDRRDLTSLSTEKLFDLLHRAVDIFADTLGVLAVSLHKIGAYVGGDREARGNRNAQALPASSTGSEPIPH